MSLATEAQSFGLLDPKLCYLLDGILFIYGVIVTALYLRAKVGSLGSCGGNVGSSIGRMCGGALALESPVWARLGVHGQGRGQPSVHSGWTVPRWHTGQDNEPRLGA